MPNVEKIGFEHEATMHLDTGNYDALVIKNKRIAREMLKEMSHLPRQVLVVAQKYLIQHKGEFNPNSIDSFHTQQV